MLPGYGLGNFFSSGELKQRRKEETLRLDRGGIRRQGKQQLEGGFLGCECGAFFLVLFC